jgi:AraC family transcriptional regulator, regulatory protein of adaptative response / methylated-DNA-[protein]-cysteine methyltransferase
MNMMPDDPASDYQTVRRVIEIISKEWREQPQLEELASGVGMPAAMLQRVFTRWAGLSPKAFLQAVTLDHAKRLLDADVPILDASLELGLSGPGRLHDLFVTHEALSPGEYKQRGAGIEMRYGLHDCQFGQAVVIATPRGLAGLAFCDPGDEKAALEDMMARWPGAVFREDTTATRPYAQRTFDRSRWRADEPLRIVLIGTDFEIRVWEGLLGIPMGRTTTYSALAKAVGRPQAPRAVGRAVGRNPLSFVVPCHRVIGKSGDLTGYHWGLTRKRAMLGWEAAAAGG